MDTPSNNLEAPLRNAVYLLKRCQARTEELENAAHEPIAIVGTALRFPGGADTPAAFWRNLCDGVDAIREIPADRWDVDAYFDPRPLSPGKMNTRWGGFLGNIDKFDPEFFGISPREATQTDPQQRMLLEVAWEALESAGLPPPRLAGTKGGVYVGVIGNDYAFLQAQAGVALDGFMGTGNAHSIAANRLSYVFDLRGPSVALDTACSSSLVTVHLACQSLRRGEIDFAVAGGVNLIMHPEMTIVLSQAQMLSPDGRCKTFDAGANGYVRGEGCGVVVLKRLRDAEANGDRILAVIRGTAVNQDGRSNGISAPNGPAQEAVIRAALADARVAPTDIGYVETHGTGTSLGDPIEVEALRNVLGERRDPERPLVLGAVKTNIGHLESAAGIVALIKATLALHNEAIPPNLHLATPNPKLPLGNGVFKLPDELLPWPRGERPRLAGVSSFGFGGTNAHIIVGEAPAPTPPPSVPAIERARHILTLSARNEPALKEMAGRYLTQLESNPECVVADLAYSANTLRAHFGERAAIVIKADAPASHEVLRQGLEALQQENALPFVRSSRQSEVRSKDVVFLFTGQGSQYAQMGMSLYDTQPLFRDVLQRCDQLLQQHAGFSLLSLLGAAADVNADLHQTQYTQPALFALEYALAQLWMSWGVRPTAVMGHSVGEYVAACVAGVYSLEDGIRLIAERARLMQALPHDGRMVAVSTTPEKLTELLAAYPQQLALAAVNGPHSCVISGHTSAIDAAVAQLQADGVTTQVLATSHAFHSPLMEPMLDEFERFVAAIPLAAPSVPLISNLTGASVEPNVVTTASYWRRHIREAVKFKDGIDGLWQQGRRMFLEVGPSATLIGLGRQCVGRGESGIWLSSLRKGRNEWETILESLAAVYTAGVDVDWAAFDAPYARQRLDTPSYPFQRQRFWSVEPGAGTTRAEVTHQASATGYPLLGSKLRLALNGQEIFEARLTPDQPAVLRDHVIYGRVVMPGMAYLEQALAAAATLSDGDWMLEDVSLARPLVLDPKRPVTVQTIVTAERFDSYQFKIVSLVEADETRPAYFVTHAFGRIRLDADAHSAAQTTVDLQQLRNRFDGTAYDDEWRRAILRKSGMQMGPGFTWMTEHWYSGDNESIGHMRPARAADNVAGFVFHPGAMDCGIQLAGSMLPGAGIDAIVPVAIKRVRVLKKFEADAWYHSSITAKNGSTAEAEVRMYSPAGEPLLALDGVKLQRVTSEWVRRALGERHPQWLYKLQWQTAALPPREPASAESGGWLVLDDERGVGAAVAGLLRAHGEHCDVVAAAETSDEVCARVRAAIDADTVPCRGVIHCSSLDAGRAGECLPKHIALARERAWGRTLDVVQALTDDTSAKLRLYLVTRAAQTLDGSTAGVALAQSPLWGLARVIAAEHPELNCTRIDLDPNASVADDARTLVQEILAADREDQILYRDDARYVARLTALEDGAGSRLEVPDGQPYRLEITSRGELEHVQLRPVARRTPGAGEVEIEVRATGLNFRDVLNVLGLYPGNPGPLGGECAGVITAVGDGVQNLSVGDSVFGLVPASFASHAVTSARFVARTPQSLSDAEAATLPIAFLTAHHALRRLGEISPGDRVLIHAASGGVGLAAVQIAQRAGAEIFATAGSDEKRQFLRDLGITHVLDSRSLEFADQVKALTQGHGVKLVLNSLTGESIAGSLSVMADHGHFLELGKTDLWNQERVAAVNPTLRFHAIALDNMMATVPEYVEALLQELLPEIADARLKPLPLKIYPIQQTVAAFRHMARAKHIGKVVVSSASAVDAHALRGPIREDGAYLITGGLGGLGLKFAKWLVDKGARHLVLTGRSGANENALASIDELRLLGAEIDVVKADISRRDDVQRLLAAIKPPLRGVLHAAGTLDDGIIREQTRERFDTVMASKVLGALHLHELTRGSTLDLFVLFSSAASLLGSPGQANYAAANAFLDALAHERRRQGLAALSINWGAWAEVGMAAELDRAKGNRLEGAGVERIDLERGLETFGHLLECDEPQVAVLPLDWGKLLGRLPQGMEPPWLLTIAAATRTQKQDGARPDLKKRLAEMEMGGQVDVVLAFVREQAALVMGSSANLPDPQRPINELGFDSLMGVELCNALSNAVGRHLPPTILFDHPTLEKLSLHLAYEVLGLAPPEPTPPKATDHAVDRVLADVKEMSEQEMDALVTKELQAS